MYIACGFARIFPFPSYLFGPRDSVVRILFISEATNFIGIIHKVSGRNVPAIFRALNNNDCATVATPLARSESIFQDPVWPEPGTTI